MYIAERQEYIQRNKAVFKQESYSHSIRLFCSGVPVRIILLLDRIEFIALETADASFFNMCPSSQTTKSGPRKKQEHQISPIFYNHKETGSLQKLKFVLMMFIMGFIYLAPLRFFFSFYTSIYRRHSGKLQTITCKIFKAGLYTTFKHMPIKIVYPQTQCILVCIFIHPVKT